MITQTVVFQFATHEQRKAVLEQIAGMLFADECPRVSGLSVDDELRRAELMREALDRYSDHYDLRHAIEALAEASNLQDWSWDKHDADA